MVWMMLPMLVWPAQALSQSRSTDSKGTSMMGTDKPDKLGRAGSPLRLATDGSLLIRLGERLIDTRLATGMASWRWALAFLLLLLLCLLAQSLQFTLVPP